MIICDDEITHFLISFTHFNFMKTIFSLSYNVKTGSLVEYIKHLVLLATLNTCYAEEKILFCPMQLSLAIFFP